MFDKLTLLKAVEMLRNKEISSVEMTKESLKRAKESKSNAFVTICETEALDMAKNADEKIIKGENSPLLGLPIAIKDLFCTKNIRTTACSKMLENFVPPYESDVTQKLWNDGAVCLGKTNMDEFGMGSANINSFFGPVISNWRSKSNPTKDLVPGGSSGGSAVAVSSGICLASTGSDTGGSIRQPAAFCGIVGVKPSYGMCSRYGMVAFASSLDQAGVLTKTVKDAAYLMQSIAGATSNDSVMHKHAKYDFTSMIDGNINGLKIGIPKEFHSEHVAPDIMKAWDESIKNLEKRGAIIKEINLPHAEKSLNIYYIIAPAEASSNLARYDGVRYGFRADGDFKNIHEMYVKSRSMGFGEEVQRRIMIGTFVLSSKSYNEQYLKAMKVRRVIKNDFDAAFKKIDAIICPTTPNTAFGIKDKFDNPVLMYLNDIYTVPVNLVGLPGISVPCGLSSDGLPIGMQVITNSMQDVLMYKIADVLENYWKQIDNK